MRSGAFRAGRVIGGSSVSWRELGVLGNDPGLLHQVEDGALPLDPLLGQVGLSTNQSNVLAK